VAPRDGGPSFALRVRAGDGGAHGPSLAYGTPRARVASWDPAPDLS